LVADAHRLAEVGAVLAAEAAAGAVPEPEPDPTPPVSWSFWDGVGRIHGDAERELDAQMRDRLLDVRMRDRQRTSWGVGSVGPGVITLPTALGEVTVDPVDGVRVVRPGEIVTHFPASGGMHQDYLDLPCMEDPAVVGVAEVLAAGGVPESVEMAAHVVKWAREVTGALDLLAGRPPKA
jgi:hypothetical protein